jgi:hypothetical protein
MAKLAIGLYSGAYSQKILAEKATEGDGQED